MDSSDGESDVSDLESNPFAKRTLRSPKYIPKSAKSEDDVSTNVTSSDNDVITVVASSTSPSSDSLKRRVPDNWGKEAFEDPTPPSSPSKRLCDMRFDPSGHMTDTNFSASASPPENTFGGRSQNKQQTDRNALEGRFQNTQCADRDSEPTRKETSRPVPLRMKAGGRKSDTDSNRKSAPPGLVFGSGRLNQRSGNFDRDPSSSVHPFNPRAPSKGGRSGLESVNPREQPLINPGGARARETGVYAHKTTGRSNLKVEFHRLPGEKLGMVMGLEEEKEEAGKTTVNVVVVKSITSGGAAARAKVTNAESEREGAEQGLRTGDRIVEINGRKISSLTEEECLCLLQEMPLDCVMLVQRENVPSPSPRERLGLSRPVSLTSPVAFKPPPASSTSSVTLTSPVTLTSYSTSSMTLTSPVTLTSPKPSPRQQRSSVSPTSDIRSPNPLSPSVPSSRMSGGHSGAEGANQSTSPTATEAHTKMSSSSKPVAAARTRKANNANSGSKVVVDTGSTSGDTSGYDAQTGYDAQFPGFTMRRVTIEREEGQNLGISIVPSYGATRDFYQIKRLLPSGVCAKGSGLTVGDRLIACNGQSLQHLTQSQCLEVLKSAGPSVALTVLHLVKEGEGEDTSLPVPSRRKKSKENAEGGKKPGVSLIDVRRKEKGAEQIFGNSSRTPEDGALVPKHVTVTSVKPSRPSRSPRSEPSKGLEDTDKMSNPFLDPEPSAEGDNTQNQNGSAGVMNLSKSNPFYEELLGTQAGDQPDAAPPGFTDNTENSEVDTGDILVNIGEESGAQSLTQQSNGVSAPAGLHFDQQHFSIPPPMEFSDSLIGDVSPSGQATGETQSPVTNIDDLLGMDVSDTSMSASVPVAIPVSTNGAAAKDGSSSDESFDFLLDEEEARKEHEPLAGIEEEEAPPPVPSERPPPVPEEEVPKEEVSEEVPPSLPSEKPPPVPVKAPEEEIYPAEEDIPSLPSKAPPQMPVEGPPPIPDEPPPVPKDTVPDESPDQDISEEFKNRDKTSLFLPSDNPADNVTQVSVSLPTPRDSKETESKTVHKTDITVTSPKTPSVTSVSVTPAKATPEASKEERPAPGPAVVNFDAGSPPVSAQIQFDTSVSKPVTNITMPPGAFSVTTQGITKMPKSGEGEEEEITPMMVCKDHLGNKMAAPSPPETLGRQTLGPRRLDESAKRDLQTVLLGMKDVSPICAGNVLASTNVPSADGTDVVEEEEIVPVKLTRKEAETAEMVLKSWMSGEKKESPASEKPTKKSAFQRAVGTMIDVQTGKTQLPENAVPFTTIGITRDPKELGEAEEEEEIKPMTVHKDHLGKKHFAPSPPETLGKQAGLRKLDEAGKQDIAKVMSVMSARPFQPPSPRVSKEKDSDFVEESIVPTKLSREDARTALSVLSKWSSGESAPEPKSTSSSFQRLVVNVLDGKVDKDKKDQTVHASVINVGKERAPVEEKPSSKPEEKLEYEREKEPEKEEIIQASSATQESTPPAVPPEVQRKPSPPDVRPRSELSGKHSLTEPVTQKLSETESSTQKLSETSVQAKPAPKSQKAFETSLQTKPTTAQTDSALKSTAEEAKPVPSQRGLRAPIRLNVASVSQLQPSSLAPKPLSKIGTLSVGSRGTSLLSRTSKPEYAKSRTEDEPFLVEVLKGIVGLGVKVTVTPEGHAQITEVQRNSPVDKNGNVRAGDYLLCVNNTELTGLPDGRVQQVLRLLPRGLVKLVVSTQPPETQGKETATSVSPRPAGAYSQYGVRLSPRPFSPTASDGLSASPLTSPSTPPVSETAASSAPFEPSPSPVEPSSTPVEPLNVSVDSEEDSDMTTRKLTKALSPRSYAVQNYSPPEPPKPAPRQRASVPTSLSQPASDGDSDPGQISPRKAERKMTANEIVAAASRRPSGRDDDLPAPPDTASPREINDEGSLDTSSPRSVSSGSTSSMDPVVEASRHPAGVSSPRDEALPVFVETAKKVPPVPSPRQKTRSSSQETKDSTGEKFDTQEARDNTDGKSAASCLASSPVNDRDGEIVKAQVVQVEIKPQSAPPPTHSASPSGKIPPPVAPKPKRTTSTSSASSSHSDDTAKDLPSPTMVSAKLRDFVDTRTPSVGEQEQSRKRVTSAARMFEKKAEESAKPMPTHTQPKTSKSISSVIKSFNREPEPEPKQEKVVLRKVSLGVSAGSEGGRPINSALLPPSERRKSMPNPTGTSSFSLTKPSPLVQMRHTSRDDKRKPAETEEEKSSRINAALMPRRSMGYSNTTSLKSISALRDSREEKRMSAPPSVGKDSFSKFSPSSPLSKHEDTSPHGRHVERAADDSRSPRMIFTSSSLHQTDRYRPASWMGGDSHDPNLESTMKKFDDLLSDKHTFDSDDELPKVSNSVSLDLLKSRNAPRVAASMKSKEEAAASQASPSKEAARPEEAKQEVRDDKPPETRESKEEKDLENTEPAAVEKEPEAAKPEVTETDKVDEGRDVEPAPPVSEVSQDVVAETQQKKEPDQPFKSEETEKPSDQEAAKEVVTEKPDEDITAASAVKGSDVPVLDDETPEEVPQNQEAEDEEKEAEEDTHDDKTQTEGDGDEAYTNAREMIYERQAKDIVSTVMSRALMEVAIEPNPLEASGFIEPSSLEAGSFQPAGFDEAKSSEPSQDDQQTEEPEDRSTTPSPPPLPDEGPPPLPGAPPPPLILRIDADRLIDAADLIGVVPSQDGSAADDDVTQSADVKVEIDETIFAQPVQQNFSASLAPESDQPASQQNETSDVLISLDTAPSDSKPTVLTELSDSVSGEKDVEREDAENHPVSDTLSQDSGVQDEDMSEDGLRFSQDDSPTGHVDSSVFDSVTSPEDEVVPPASGNVDRDFATDSRNADSQPVSKQDISDDDARLHTVPVMSEDTETVDTVTHSTVHPHDTVTFTAKSLNRASPIVTGVHLDRVPQLQDSSSPKCSSPRQKEEAEEFPGGVSTTGNEDREEGDVIVDSNVNKQENVQGGEDETDSEEEEEDEDDVEDDATERKDKESSPREAKFSDGFDEESARSAESSSKPSENREPDATSSTPSEPSEQSTQPDSLLQASADVHSSRKWCILDQSGSLFLHGAAQSTVTVPTPDLRRVSSLTPAELAAMIKSGNEELDAAKASLNVELRVVGARGLDGKALEVDVFQRQDYLVQVTGVTTKYSPVEEADLLLSVDGRSLKNKRPAQVHSQLDSTGPKGVILTARGVKLPPSAVKADDSTKASRAPPPTQSAPPPPASTSGDAPPVIPAVSLGGGVYEVVMIKGATGVGFCLEGGKSSPKGDLPIQIKRIFKGGPAEKCGQLQVKDEILSVNGVDFTNMRHYEAWNHLKFLDDGEIRLRIRRPNED